MKIKDTLIVLFIVGAMSLVANAIGTKYTIVEAIPGLLFLIFLAIAGVVLAKYLPGRIPYSFVLRFSLMPVSLSAKTLMLLPRAAGGSL